MIRLGAHPLAGIGARGTRREWQEVRRRLPARAVSIHAAPTTQEPRIAAPDLIRERIAFRPIAPLTCDVEPHRDGVRIIPIGELDMNGAPIADARLSEVRAAGFRRLILDLRRVTFIDVAGLRLVLGWTDALLADGEVAFEVIPGPPHVQRIFALTATADGVAFVDAGDVRRPRALRVA